MEEIPQNIRERVIKATENLLPVKSRQQYDREYGIFGIWKDKNTILQITENVLMAYFQELFSENMEFAVPLIFLSIFVFASISLFLVYKFGIKKKSYEEALAEHRKNNSALLATKPKSKEKKSKKAAKRINKEKVTAINNSENETPDDTESVDLIEAAEKTEKGKSASQHGKSEPKATVKTLPKQSKIHVEFKEEPEEVPAEVPVEKEIKDVINKKRVKKVRPILVKKTSGTGKILPVETESPLTNHFEEIHPKDEFELKRLNSQKEDIYKSEPQKEEKKIEKSLKKSKNQKQEIQPQPVDKIGFQTDVQAIEKEKSKEEKIVENAVTPLNQECVVNTAKEKKKKKSEFNARQQLTAERDHLVYSVRNAELSRTEVQLLIDILLNKQLETPTVIDDWSEGKSDPIQKLKKQLAEKEKLLIDEQEALAGVQAKLKEVRSEQLTERAQLQQKLRGVEESKGDIVAAHNRLQLKIQELEDLRIKEHGNFQRVVEDNKALQMQRGQLEAALMNYQETDTLILNLKTDNTHLSNELQRLTQELQEQATNYQNCVIQIQTLQEELRSRNDYVINMERNHSFAITAQMEEKRGVTDELQRLTDNAHKEEQRLVDIIEQLKADNRKLREEANVQINGSSDENKAHEIKLLNIANELSSVKSELSSVNEKFQDAERQYQSESELSGEQYRKLKSELEEQKHKNNELRKKNWKVMEALNAAESRSKPAASKSADVVNIDLITLEIKSREQAAQKEFLQRLFPEIKGLALVTTDDWQAEFEPLIKQHIAHLQQDSVDPPKSVEVTKLQNEIGHYKKIIDETEGILKRLQSHIEQEEIDWRVKLAQKDAEIEELKSKYISQLQVKVSSLESQLAEEQIEKQRLLDEHHQLMNKPEAKAIHSDSTATIERLSEEVNRLKEQLRIEETSSDANVYQNGKTS